MLFGTLYKLSIKVLPNLCLFFLVSSCLLAGESLSFAGAKTAKLKLKNDLEVFLVSDPEAQQSAAALVVDVGSWQDPDSFPGLAHYLEHALFLGTKKYPKENDFDRYIKENGGSTNGVTDHEMTLFVFNVRTDAFADGLERFSAFFKKPLFPKAGVKREIIAIDQEFHKNLDNDAMRLLYATKMQAKKEHPFHRFHMGNQESLKEATPEILERWYRKYYSADKMHLILYSNLPLDELKKLATEDFQDILKTKTPPLTDPGPLLPKDAKGRLVFVEPSENLHELLVVWDIPTPFVRNLEERPGTLIAHLLGHEGPGSLIAYLKDEELATDINVSEERLSQSHELFSVNITLTRKGVREKERVIESVFQTINQIKSEESLERNFEELQKMNTLIYQFPMHKEPLKIVYELGRSMSFEPLETFPQQSMIIGKYSANTLFSFLQELSPDKALYLLLTKKRKDQLAKIEPWMGFGYREETIPKATLEKWSRLPANKEISLPGPNPFLPSTPLSLPSCTKDYEKVLPTAELIRDTPLQKVYYAPCHTFEEPKAYVLLRIKMAALKEAGVEQMVYLDLFLKSIKNAINDWGYLAKLAGIEYTLAQEDVAFSLSLYGFSENLGLFLKKFAEMLKTLQITEEMFEQNRISLIRNYKNQTLAAPYEQARDLLEEVLYKYKVGALTKLKKAKEITFQGYTEFAKNALSSTFTEGIFYGHITHEMAQKSFADMESALGTTPYTHPLEQEVIVLPKDKGPFYIERKTSLKGNGIQLAINTDSYSPKTRGVQDMLSLALSESFFTELRTNQQIGYIVANYSAEIQGELFLLCMAQSSNHEGKEMLDRFEGFFEDYYNKIEHEIPKERLEILRRTTIQALKRPAKDLREMGELLDKICFEYKGDLNRIEERIKALQNTTYEEFLSLAKQMIGRSNRRRVATICNGQERERDKFDYSKAASPSDIRAFSRFTSRYNP